MGRNPEKQVLREQCERLGIVLSSRALADDCMAALDAYARGYANGCEKSYHEGVAAGQKMAAEPDWSPANWPEAETKLGRVEARRKYPVLYSEHMRLQRELARRRG